MIPRFPESQSPKDVIVVVAVVIVVVTFVVVVFVIGVVVDLSLVQNNTIMPIESLVEFQRQCNELTH